MKKNGFSLIEFTVYLALFSFISMLFLGVASRAQLKFMSVSSDQENLHRQTVAIDLLRRDLISASPNFVDWDIQPSSAAKQTVFKKLTLTDKNLPQSTDISWFIGNQGLMRAQGEYDFGKHDWIRKTSCIVCKSIKEISFVLQKNFLKQNQENRLECRGVWVIYKSVSSIKENRILEQKVFVKFRNRVVMCET